MFPVFLCEPGLDREIKNFFYLTFATNFIAIMLAAFLPEGIFGENIGTRNFFGSLALLVPIIFIIILFDRFKLCQNYYTRDTKPIISPLLHSGPVFILLWALLFPNLPALYLALLSPLFAYSFTAVAMLILELFLHYRFFEYRVTQYGMGAVLIVLFYKMSLMF